jgi:hypothetical protein
VKPLFLGSASAIAIGLLFSGPDHPIAAASPKFAPKFSAVEHKPYTIRRRLSSEGTSANHARGQSGFWRLAQAHHDAHLAQANHKNWHWFN